MPEAPFFVKAVLPNRILGVFHNAVDGDDPFGYEVDPFDLRNRWNVALDKIQARLDRFSEILCRDGRSCSAADDMLALL